MWLQRFGVHKLARASIFYDIEYCLYNGPIKRPSAETVRKTPILNSKISRQNWSLVYITRLRNHISRLKWNLASTMTYNTQVNAYIYANRIFMHQIFAFNGYRTLNLLCLSSMLYRCIALNNASSIHCIFWFDLKTIKNI